MTVYVNDVELSLFEGACVIDAINCYICAMKQALSDQLPEITDRYGHLVAPEGALTEGCRLYCNFI